MSTLKEGQCYGLSGGSPSSRGVSVLHVKLTDSAARAISSFQQGKGRSAHPTICFNGNQGRITVPCSEKQQELRIFTFSVTNVARDNPHGSFDCVQQLSTSAAEELSCLGMIQKKMTVNATDDSYDKARQSMAQAEEETRSRGAIVIKHGGRYQGKKVTVRPPAPALAGLTKPRPPSRPLLSNVKRPTGLSKPKRSAFASGRKNSAEVLERPLSERVCHLLALRPYRRPELILRLQRDGLAAADKDTLDSVLLEVGQVNSRDNTFVLKDGLYKELKKDWPGYTSGDQQLLKRILVRRLFQPQQNLLTVPEAQVSPLRDTPNSSPAHRPKPSLQEDYTDPLASKKPRISHFSNKAAAEPPRVKPSKQPSHRDTTGDNGQKNSLDPQRLFDSLSAVCQRDAEAAKRLEPAPGDPEEPEASAEQPQANCERPSLQTAPGVNRRTVKRKKSKHKHKDQDKDKNKDKDKDKDRWRDRKEQRKDQSSEDANSKTEPSKALFATEVPEGGGDAADYLLTYARICSPERRQSYKQDFNREYSEYRDLHARIDSVTRQFMELDTQLKQLHHGSHKYKTVRNQIVQEYRKIKKSNPNYNQEKSRCEYLHNKLAHIKKLISEYDQQQLRSGDSGVN